MAEKSIGGFIHATERDVTLAEATALADPPPPALGSGRGRASPFVQGPVRHGVRLECTEFRRKIDLGGEGWVA